MNTTIDAPRPTSIDPDGLAILTHAPDGSAWDQEGEGCPSDLCESRQYLDAPEPVPSDLDDSRPWYHSAPFDAELDGVFYNLSEPEAFGLPVGVDRPLDDSDLLPSIRRAMRVTAEDEARMYGGF